MIIPNWMEKYIEIYQMFQTTNQLLSSIINPG